MKKILVGIPVLYHGDVCLQAFKSIIEEADLLIVDNGSEADVKEAINQMHIYNNGSIRVGLIRNDKNKYVNPAWNQILGSFLDANCPYEQLIIMNSDLVMQPGWSDKIKDGISCIPTDGSHASDTLVTEGTPGVFIHLNKTMAKIAYPIPDAIKIWYGDNWIYDRIRKAGFETIVRTGMICTHIGNGSRTVNLVPNKTEIIAQDQVAWAELVKEFIVDGS